MEGIADRVIVIMGSALSTGPDANPRPSTVPVLVRLPSSEHQHLHHRVHHHDQCPASRT